MGSGNNRNFIIAIGLSIAVLVLWQVFIANPQIDAARDASTQQATLDANLPGADTPVVGTPAAPAAAAVAAGEPAAPTNICTAAVQSLTREDALTQTPRVTISTPALSGSVNLCGGRIDDLRLTKYRDTVEPDSPTIVLLSPARGPLGYFAEFGWIRGTSAAISGTTLWSAAEGSTLTPATPLTLTYDNGEGLVFSRVISVDDDYMFTIADTVTNNGTADVSVVPYGRVTRNGEPTTTGAFILHEGMIGFLADQGLEQVNYSALVEEPKVFPVATTGWLGITDKYWAAAMIPDQERPFASRFVRLEDSASGLRYQAEFTGAGTTLAPGMTTTNTNNLFAGAKEVVVVDGYDRAMNLDRFELLIDWGWFYFITKPMFTALDFLYRLVGNFGVAILLVTVAIKLVFFPLANRSYRSMAKMRKVGPQITALRERHKDDRAKQQQAMLEIYKKEKINPVAGCWPVLIQIPVFFALYKVLYVTIEMRHEPFFGWIRDLSAPDPTSIFNLFGLLPFDAPVFLQIGVWPVIMGFTMWAQFQLNPQAPGTPKWIFNLLPLVFTFMLSSFPAGLVIYWAWNNFLSVVQQSVIMRRNGVSVDLFDNIRGTFRRKPKSGAKAKS